jgi:triacylglycerol esterase/lipase EstA (alpha/beta hydrolase family)
MLRLGFGSHRLLVLPHRLVQANDTLNLVRASLSPQRRRFVAGAAGVVVTAVAVTTVFVALSGRAPAPADQSRPGPVILVPGYGGDIRSLADLASRLRRAGHQAQVLSLPAHGTGDLQGQAVALQRAVAADLRHGAPSVDVIGYSAGGVAVRLWASEDDHAATARRIVTIGSPQHGTTVAAAAGLLLGAGCTGGCSQLQPGSPLLDGLNDGDETPNGPLWLSVWSTADQTVVPPSSASLVGADDLTVQSFCPRDHVSHSGEPRDPAVIGLVLAALGTGPLPRPHAGDCTRLSALGSG